MQLQRRQSKLLEKIESEGRRSLIWNNHRTRKTNKQKKQKRDRPNTTKHVRSGAPLNRASFLYTF